MGRSDVVEMSADNLKMRPKEAPEKWPLDSTTVMTFSNLKVDVPEFVPGQMYQYTPQGTGNLRSCDFVIQLFVKRDDLVLFSGST